MKIEFFNNFLLLHPEVNIFFVNDGSTDDTIKIIEPLLSNVRAILINLPRNLGKGEAVRQGLIRAVSLKSFDYIGYLDADLSTSLDEYYEIYTYACKQNVDFIFGSRIKKLGSVIKRSFLRHTIGRLLATILDKKFQLGYYDTQCGAKLFKSQLIDFIIQEPFSTKWFFDLELFLRIKKQNKNYIGIEYPLKSWNNTKGSKLGFQSAPSICREIIVLLSNY